MKCKATSLRCKPTESEMLTNWVWDVNQLSLRSKPNRANQLGKKLGVSWDGHSLLLFSPLHRCKGLLHFLNDLNIISRSIPVFFSCIHIEIPPLPTCWNGGLCFTQDLWERIKGPGLKIAVFVASEESPYIDSIPRYISKITF